MVLSGEQIAWDILTELDAGRVAKNAAASYNSDQSVYGLKCFGQDIFVSLPDKTILFESERGRLLVNILGSYFRLSVLRYLIHASNRSLCGELVRPAELPGGDIFEKGTHVLPLTTLAASYTNNRDGFEAIGRNFKGSQLDYGDMSLELFPFPKVPVVIIVWSGDEEFPPHASLLFDSSCVAHLPIDIIWSTAMIVVESMLINTNAHNQLQS